MKGLSATKPDEIITFVKPVCIWKLPELHLYEGFLYRKQKLGDLWLFIALLGHC